MRGAPPAAVGGGVDRLALALVRRWSALLGPFFAPYDPASLRRARRYSPPSDEFPLGFDYLGRDALSRFLWGGRTAIVLAVLGYAARRIARAHARARSPPTRAGVVDAVFDRSREVLLGFPALIFMLLLVAGLGVASSW